MDTGHDRFLSYAFLFRTAFGVAREKVVRVADIGCGKGGVLLALADRVETFVGLDPDSNSLTKARERLLRKGVSPKALALICGDFESRAGQLGTFDLVCCEMSFHHFASTSAAKQLRSLLSSNGTLILVDYVSDQSAFGFPYIREQLAAPFMGPHSIGRSIGRFGIVSVFRVFLGRVYALCGQATRAHMRSDLSQSKTISRQFLCDLIDGVFNNADLWWFPGGVFLLEYRATPEREGQAGAPSIYSQLTDSTKTPSSLPKS